MEPDRLNWPIWDIELQYWKYIQVIHIYWELWILSVHFNCDRIVFYWTLVRSLAILVTWFLLKLPFFLLKPPIFQETNPRTLNISGNKSSNSQYFWQQILESSIFLATNWPALQILDISGNKLTTSISKSWIFLTTSKPALQILNTSGNKLTSSAGNRVARIASQLFDSHKKRRAGRNL